MFFFQLRIDYRIQHKGVKFLGDPTKPKTMWMLHYMRLINICGPLSLYETNIAEQKNGKLRKLSTKANQTKNVLHTISSR